MTETRGYELRLTDDVDVVADVESRAGYYALQQELKKRGFREDPEARVLCRLRRDDLVLDLMPADPTILGFSNRWYDYAIESANRIELAPVDSNSAPVTIRLVSPSCFVATKLDAYLDRGEGDYHEDIEDVVTLIDGRPELLAELEAEREDLREYVSSTMTKLLALGLEDKIAGLMFPDESSQARVPLVIATCRRIARMGAHRSDATVPSLPTFAFVWTLQFREGRFAGFHVKCWPVVRDRALERFWKRPPIARSNLSRTLNDAVEAIWVVARSLIEGHFGVDAVRPNAGDTGVLAREVQTSGAPSTALRLFWQPELEHPGSVDTPLDVPLETKLGGALRALDTEAARVAAESIQDALASKAAWDDS
jgi:hypothetical protein